MGFEVEWDDWYAYQQLHDLSENLHNVACHVLGHGRGVVDDAARVYMVREFTSILDNYDVALEDIVRHWLERQVYKQRLSQEHAEQVIAALELLNVEPKAKHDDSDVPIHGIIS